MRTGRVLLVLAGAVFVAASCSGGDDGGTAATVSSASAPAPGATPAGSTAVPDGAHPAPDLATALAELLTFEQAGDRAGSYTLLSAASRAEFPSESAWERRRAQLPTMTGFRIESSTAGSAVAVVEHQPGLDPFVGLGARERQTWTGVQTASGWLVNGEPDREYVLPPDDGAAPSAKSWLQAVQACDRPTAMQLQAVPELFGDLTPASGLCGTHGDVVTGAVGMLASGPASGDIVAQYTTDALVWTRLVRIDAPVALGVVMAPIGDQWRVLGVTP